MAADDGPARSVGAAPVVPVPAALFGPLLERVSDLTTLRCALRAVFLLHRKGGRSPVVTAPELAVDPVLGLRGDEGAAARALEWLAAEGALLRAEAGYCLATPSNRRLLAEEAGLRGGQHDGPGPWAPAPAAPRADVFRLYEENIGVITPMAAERLKDMEAEYPPEWIKEAFEQAVLSNARSLRYVEAVLQRWRDDGRGDGKPTGRTGTVRLTDIIRRRRESG